jgi:hypothetical protein
VALEVKDTSLVTADEHYYRKASVRGSIVLLNSFSLPGGEAAKSVER